MQSGRSRTSVSDASFDCDILPKCALTPLRKERVMFPGGLMLRPLAPLAAAMLLLSITPAARADSPRRLTWDELPRLIGKHVSIALYDGGAVAGKVREIQAD